MTALAVLEKVLPPEALEEVNGLLSDKQAAELAVHAADLERMESSGLLAEVPKDAVTCHAVSDLSLDAKTAFAELEISRKARTEDARNEVSRVNALYGLLTGRMESIKAKADDHIKAFNRLEKARELREKDERDRKAREAAEAEAVAVAKANAAKTEDERKAALAEADEAARAGVAVEVQAVTVAPTAYKSAAGTSSITTRIVLDAFDYDKVEEKYKKHPDVMEALRKVLAAAVRSGYRPPGCELKEEEGVRGSRR